MNDEKQMILEMLKEGKITVEEASNLIDALGGKKSRSNSDFVSKLSQSLDSVIKRTSETISNFDLDNIDINQFNIKGETNTHKEMRIDDEINSINIDIPNGKVLVERASDSAITLTQDIWAKKGDLLDYLEIDINGDNLEVGINESYHNFDATSILHLSLGKNLYDNLDIDLINGNIEIEDVDFNATNINSVNAKINIINSCGNIDINNTNGKIDLKNTNGYLSVNNVNGSVYLSNISGESADINAVSGNIRVDGLDVKKYKADTHSGNIRIYNIKDSKEVKLNSGFGNITVDSQDFTGDIKANVLSQGLNISDKYKNKMQKNKGYEISTNVDKTDLEINASAGFGKINLR